MSGRLPAVHVFETKLSSRVTMTGLLDAKEVGTEGAAAVVLTFRGLKYCPCLRRTLPPHPSRLWPIWPHADCHSLLFAL